MTKWLSKWLYRMVQRGERDLVNSSTDAIRPASNMERMFGDCAPALVAFRIENGYVMRVVDTSLHMSGTTPSGFVYCKDHAAIAEHIITEAAKQRLDLDPRAKKDAMMRQQSLSYGSQAGGSYAAKSP